MRATDRTLARFHRTLIENMVLPISPNPVSPKPNSPNPDPNPIPNPKHAVTLKLTVNVTLSLIYLVRVFLSTRNCITSLIRD